MASPAIVCPPEPDLLRRLRGHRVAVRAAEPALAAEAAALARAAGATLVAVLVRSDGPLSRLAPPEDWEGLPLALFVPAMGAFRDLRPGLATLKGLNLRVYLPAAPAERLDELRVLASVGLPCAAVLGPEEPDWDALTDLATYALLERTPHAPLEPFAFVGAHFAPGRNLRPWRTWFDDPETWVHADATGRLALSAAEADAGRFDVPGEALGDLPRHPRYREAVAGWRRLLLSPGPCARCAGFRLCLGRFLRPDGTAGGCSSFFGELVGMASEAAARRGKPEERGTWQP